MRVFFSFFCEDATEGTYGRLNFLNVLPQKQIAIPHLDYLFSGYLVIWFTAEAAQIQKKLNIIGPDGSLIISFDFPQLPNDGLEKSVCLPLRWLIKEFGDYTIEVNFFDAVDAYKRVFKVAEGDAASLLSSFSSDTIAPSQVLGFGEKIKSRALIKKIVGRARKSVLIVDNFWSTTELSYISKSISPEVELTICVTPDKKKDAKTVLLTHKKTSVRSSKRVHDRYIFLDGTSEVWGIGTSLNHIGGKITSVNKMTSIDAINKLKMKINKIFPGILN